MAKKYDFSGWATRNDLRCSDGRVIRKDAFKINDGQEVPLIWNHQHDSVFDILGYAILHNDESGVRAECYLNDTDQGRAAREVVNHGDVRSLSIYANKLRQKGADVVHGDIKEVSMVIAGANPGAYIDDYAFAHGDDEEFEAVICCGMPVEIYHSDESDDQNEELMHSDDKKEEKKVADENTKPEEHEGGETLKDVFDTLTEKQKTAVYAMIGAAMENEANHGDEDGEDFSEGGDYEMKHNIFVQDDSYQGNVLTHSEEATILKDMEQYGSLKKSFLAHAAEYGIEQIDWLFPEDKNINGDGAPQFIDIKTDWVPVILNGVHHTPYSRVKMMFADISDDKEELRAKGYVKGDRKVEEVITLLRRRIDPQTIYKKQEFDRDDIIDITSFDVVSWIKKEMRMKLDQEIARAILIGDGRLPSDRFKIKEDHIIPVIHDDDFYTIKYTVNVASGENEAHAIINSAVRARKQYRGSGNPIFFTSEDYLADMMLLEDTTGHRLYKTEAELASAMRVSKIVTLPFDAAFNDMYGFALNLTDYNVGADKGGAVSMFDDFDIHYNQFYYMIETRISGALTVPYSAYVLKKKTN